MTTIRCWVQGKVNVKGIYIAPRNVSECRHIRKIQLHSAGGGGSLYGVARSVWIVSMEF